MALVLRKLTIHDEAAFKLAISRWDSTEFSFASLYTPDMSFADFLERIEERERGMNLPAGRVAESVVYAFVGDEIVGRASIRHALNESLLVIGGHIGYGVLSCFRRRGYATLMLQQALRIARDFGVRRALITCDDTNIGSIKVIEACGGTLENIVLAGESVRPTRRYWIDLAGRS